MEIDLRNERFSLAYRIIATPLPRHARRQDAWGSLLAGAALQRLADVDDADLLGGTACLWTCTDQSSVDDIERTEQI